MRMQYSFLMAPLLALAPVMFGATPPDPADANSVSTFSITRQTQVPGEVLKPGEYTIQIVEHISDRMIVRIDNVQGKDHLLFLGVPNLDASAGGSNTGVQTWRSGAGSLPTLRGFNFPTGTAVDFVYPKAEAAALAKANAATIIAIDPESEGRPAKLTNLSSDDMREINLWMLTLISTGPADNKVPALEAKRYLPPSPVQTAASATPSRSSQLETQQVAKLERAPVPTVSASRPRRVAAQLPHTASLLPVVWISGCLSLLVASLLFAFRRSPRRSF